MAVNVTLNDITSGYNITKINTNFDRIETALQTALSTDGTTPNSMSADIDMDGNTLLNLPAPVNPNDPVRFQDLGNAPTAAIDAEASATAAGLSEVAAATSASTASAAATSASANEKSIGWVFDTSTSMADPDVTMLRFNNGTLASVTAIAVDSNDLNSVDVSGYVATWGSSTNTNKGIITVRKVGDTSFFATFNVTSTVVDNSGWLQITVSYITGTGTLTAADTVFLHFTKSGDAGVSGGGTGDLVSTNNLSDVSSASTSRSNLGLGALATQGSVAVGQVNNNVIVEATIADGEVTLPKLATGTAGNLITYNASGNPEAVVTGTAGQILTSNGAGLPPTMQTLGAGVVVQRAYSSSSTLTTVSSAIPRDNTLPLSTEGQQILSDTITPQSSSNKISITVSIPVLGGTASVANEAAIFTVFRGTTFVGVGLTWQPDSNEKHMPPLSFTIEDSPASASLLTYKVMAGRTGGTVYLNGDSTGVRVFGGGSKYSMLIEEVTE